MHVTITVSTDDKHFLPLDPLPSSLSEISVILSSEPHPLWPLTSPLQSSMIFPLWQRARVSEGAWQRDGGRDWKKGEIQEAQAAFHFRCLAMQLCPASTVLANVAPSP